MKLPSGRPAENRRLLAGCVIGILLGFAFFLLLDGASQERRINQIRQLQAETHLLKEERRALIRAEDRKNRELEKKRTVQEITIAIFGKAPDRATRTELTHAVKAELRPLIGQNLSSVSDNRELIVKVIEKKPFIYAEITYHFKVRSIVVDSHMAIDLAIISKKDNSR
jgi:hypothetical protein